MAFQYENSGTVNVANGSKTVSGVNTSWVAGYDGCALNINGLTYPVASIDSPTQLTLVNPYTGANATGATYALLPVKNEVYNVTKNVSDAIDAMNAILESGAGGGTGTVGPRGPQGPAGESAYQIAVDNGFIGTEEEWLASLKGADGTGGSGSGGDGSSGSGGGLGSIVNLTDFKAQPAGGSGVYMIVPVAEGDPGISLTQSAQVVMPLDKPQAGIGMWIKSTTSGYAITLGLTNAPLPQPGGSSDPVDLSGSSTVYGSPGTRFDLGIYLGSQVANDQQFTVTVPSTLPFKIRTTTPSVNPLDTTWETGAAGAPYAPTGDAVQSIMVMNKGGSGTWDYQNGRVIANKGCYLHTDALGLSFTTSSDDKINQAPPRIRIGYKGIVPAGYQNGTLANMAEWAVGGISLEVMWGDPTLKFTISRNGSGVDIISDVMKDADGNDLRDFGNEHFYEGEWINDTNGPGGIVRFYIDGLQIGSDKPTEWKPRISPACDFECNASIGNTSASVDGLAVSALTLAYDQPTTVDTFTDVAAGSVTLTADELQRLCVDATHIFEDQPAADLIYIGLGDHLGRVGMGHDVKSSSAN